MSKPIPAFIIIKSLDGWTECVHHTAIELRSGGSDKADWRINSWHVSQEEFQRIYRLVGGEGGSVVGVTAANGFWYGRYITQLSLMAGEDRYMVNGDDVSKEEFNRLAMIIDTYSAAQETLAKNQNKKK